jgi:hypothetical protein
MHARNIALHAWCMVRMAHGMPHASCLLSLILPLSRSWFLLPMAPGARPSYILPPAVCLSLEP